MESVKQVIVWRGDLKVRKGKMMAQAAHASCASVLNAMRKDRMRFEFDVQPGSYWDAWLNGRFTKICVYCRDFDHLFELLEQAKAKDIPVSLITDAGLTEFNNVPTVTCISIGPFWSSEIDKITGELPLL